MLDKLDSKSDKCLFVGYPKETKGYYFYIPSENKVFVARNGVFLEREFVSKISSGSKIQLEEISIPQTEDEPEMEIQTDLHNDDESVPQQTQEPRRSGRIRHEIERYGFLITDDHDVLLMDQDEPTTYRDAINSSDSIKWLDAMKSEMKSMYDNQVWTLIDT